MPNLSDTLLSVVVESAIRNNDLHIAVERFENSYYSIWGQVLQLKTLAEELRSVEPQLADDLRRTSIELAHASASTAFLTYLQSNPTGASQNIRASSEQQGRMQRMSTVRYEALLQKARAEPGLKFPMAPTLCPVV
jgi:hypothetical protein